MNDTTTASPLAASTCPSDALPTLPEILVQDCPVDWWETSPIDFSDRHDYGDDRHLRFAWMSQLPRFGFPDDIGHVRTEDWQSYVNGLASMAAFTSVLFVLWWTVIVACRCTGKGGFLSGTLTTSSRPAQVKACRYVVVFSGVMVWIFSVLLVTKALESLKGVIALVQETLPLAEEILHEAGNATTAFLEAAGKSKAARVEFFDNISEHCEFAFPRAEQAVVELNDTLTKLGGLGIGARLEGISNTIVDTQGVLDAVEDYLDVTRESLVYVVVVAVVVIDLMVLLFLLTTGLRWWTEQQKQQNDQQQDQDLSNHPYTKALHKLQKLNCCLLPSFGITLVFTYVFSIASMVTSQLVSDVCVGDVDETIKAVVGAPPVATALLSWYVGGCLWSTRPGYVPTILNEVVVPSLRQIMEFGKTWLNQTGVVDFMVSNVVETVGETVSDVVDAVAGVVDNVGDGAIVEEALSTVVGAGQDVLNDTLSNVVDTVTDVVGGAVGGAQNWVNETASTVANVVDTVTSTVEGVQGMVNETVSNVAGSVVGSVTDAVGEAQEMVNQTVSSVAGTVETVSNVVGTVQSVSNAAGMGPVETVSAVVDTVQTVQTASNVAGAVADAATTGGGSGLVDQAVSSVVPGERLLQQVLENLANQANDNLPLADRLPDSLGLQCGFGVQAIEKSWTFLQAKFVSVLRLGLGLLKVLNCGRIHTIYYRLIHELTCEQGLTAMGQVFLWLFLLTFFSMVMVTCRAAWNPIVEANTLPLAEEEKQDQGAVMEEGGRIEPDTQKAMLVSGTKSTNYIVDERVPEDTNGTLEASGTGITMGTFSMDGTEVRVSLDGKEEDEEEVEA